MDITIRNAKASDVAKVAQLFGRFEVTGSPNLGRDTNDGAKVDTRKINDRVTRASRWSSDDLLMLRQNYYKMSVNELAKVLNRTPMAIRTRAFKLGVTVSK